MIFRNFVESALGSKTKVRVLLYLLSEGIPTSERELSRILGVSHTAINRIMKEFYDINLVTPMKIGNVTTWKMNEKSYAFWAISGMKNMATRPPLHCLKDDIRSWLALHHGVEKAIIYGSVAEGVELPESDIDLFVLVDAEESKKVVLAALSDKIGYCIEFYGNKLSPFVMTREGMRNAKNKELVQNIQKGILVV